VQIRFRRQSRRILADAASGLEYEIGTAGTIGFLTSYTADTYAFFRKILRTCT